MIGGCAFSKLENDLEQLDRSFYIYPVTISTEDVDSNAVLMVALNDLDRAEFSETRAVSKPGPFDMQIHADETYLFAFENRNMDFKYQADEQYGRASYGELLKGDQDAGDRIEIAIG
jgi:hypothetical protein